MAEKTTNAVKPSKSEKLQRKLVAKLTTLTTRRRGIVDSIDEKIAYVTHLLSVEVGGSAPTPSRAVRTGAKKVKSVKQTGPRETHRARLIRLFTENPGVHYRELLTPMGLEDNEHGLNTIRSLLSGLGKAGKIEKAGEPGHWQVTALGLANVDGRKKPRRKAVESIVVENATPSDGADGAGEPAEAETVAAE